MALRCPAVGRIGGNRLQRLPPYDKSKPAQGVQAFSLRTGPCMGNGAHHLVVHTLRLGDVRGIENKDLETA